MLVEFSFDNFVARLFNELQLVGGQFTEVGIYERRCFLQDAESANHLAWHLVVADVEMQQ